MALCRLPVVDLTSDEDQPMSPLTVSAAHSPHPQLQPAFAQRKRTSNVATARPLPQAQQLSGSAQSASTSTTATTTTTTTATSASSTLSSWIQTILWVHAHRDDPFPSDVEKSQLASRTHLTREQIDKFFMDVRGPPVHRASVSETDDSETGTVRSTSIKPKSRSKRKRVASAPDTATIFYGLTHSLRYHAHYTSSVCLLSLNSL